MKKMKKNKLGTHEKIKRYKKMKFFLVLILLVFCLGLVINFIGFENIITGLIILPTEIEGKEKVIDYVQETRHFNEFDDLIKEKPILEEINLCKNRDVCKTLEIKNRIENNNWEDSYYWYVRFSGTQVIERKNLDFVVLEKTKKIYLEFILRGSDGKIMQTHTGETAWEV